MATKSMFGSVISAPGSVHSPLITSVKSASGSPLSSPGSLASRGGAAKALQSNERLVRTAASLQRCSRMLRRRVGHKHEDRQFDRQLRLKDGMIAGSSMTGLVAMVVMDLSQWYLCGDASETVRYDKCNGWAKALLTSLQLVVTISTLACLAIILQYYQLLLIKKRKEWCPAEPRQRTKLETEAERLRREDQERAVAQGYSLWASPPMRGKMLWEFIAHLPHPIIYLTRPETQGIHSFVKVWMFLRLYVIGRILHTHSRPFQDRIEIMSSSTEFRQHGVRLKPKHTLKILFTNYTGRALTIWAVMTIVLGGFALFLAERDNTMTESWVVDPPDWAKNFELPLWFAFVTGTTIGYGDYWPGTLEGRLVTVGISVSGLCSICIFQALVTNKLRQTRTDKRIQEYCSLRRENREFKEAAARLIQRMWRERRARRILWHFPVVHRGNLVFAGVRDLKKQRFKLAFAKVASADVVLDSMLEEITEQARGVADQIQDLQDETTQIMRDTYSGSRRVRRLVHQKNKELAVERAGGLQRPSEAKLPPVTLSLPELKSPAEAGGEEGTPRLASTFGGTSAFGGQSPVVDEIRKERSTYHVSRYGSTNPFNPLSRTFSSGRASSRRSSTSSLCRQQDRPDSVLPPPRRNARRASGGDAEGEEGTAAGRRGLR
eukprot:Hpha_TRINITY_DN30289_c0_g1::TRINITY_DN30289_c0_g1_i1::g.27156::m.27156